MTGLERSGKILHVFPQNYQLYEGEGETPVRYMVEGEGEHDFPETIDASQVLEILEPLIYPCPHCGQAHIAPIGVQGEGWGCRLARETHLSNGRTCQKQARNT